MSASSPPATDLPSAIARHEPAFRRVLTALLCAGISTFGLLYCVQPLLPLFASGFGLGAAGASLSVSAATAALAVGLLAAGALSDRFGRKPVMVAALYAAAALTVLAALAPNWPALVGLRALAGLALSGAPAVAMAYVAEEVDAPAVGLAMGLYIAGTALGGMLGRLGCGMLADVWGWRGAMAATGAAGALAALLFQNSLPASRRHVRRAERLRLSDFAAPLRDPALRWLYLEAFLFMGAFVTVYNYLAFRLGAAPYRLSQTETSAVFSLYIVGMASSALVGEAAGKLGRRRVFWAPVALMLAGVGLTALAPLGWIVLGVAVVTFGFFGAHSVASSWVGRRSGAHKAAAASLYLLFYYAGSSVAGSLGGLAWSRAGWPGVAGFTGAMMALALVGALRLAAIRPLPGNA